MHRSAVLGAGIALLLLSACNGSAFGAGAAGCGSDDASKAVEDLFKEELEFALQSGLAEQKEVGSYDMTELESSVKGVRLSLSDVRTSRDDPDSSKLSCKATVTLEFPKNVEKVANEARIMAEVDNVREVANKHRLKRSGANYSGDFDYFIQQTDDGGKVFAEIDDDSSVMMFAAEVIISYLLADEIRLAKIAEDQEIAEQKRAEREAEMAYEAEGVAALETAKIERKLASEEIGLAWNSMPQSAKQSLQDIHEAWVRQMKASCAADAAGTDEREEMRQATELACQTRFVRSCAKILRTNTNSYASEWSYCRVR